MALVRNTRQHVLDLSGGQWLAVGEARNIDTSPPHEQALLADGSLILVDNSAAPAGPATHWPAGGRAFDPEYAGHVYDAYVPLVQQHVSELDDQVVGLTDAVGDLGAFPTTMNAGESLIKTLSGWAAARFDRQTFHTSSELGVPLPDGSTIVTTQIRAALAAAAPANGGLGKIVFDRTARANPYLIDGSLDIPDGLVVDQNYAWFKMVDGTNKNVSFWRFMGSQNAAVLHARLLGNRANRSPLAGGSFATDASGEVAAGNGITARTTNDVSKTYAQHLLVHDVEHYDMPNHGVEMVGCRYFHVDQVYGEGYGDDNASCGGLNASVNDLQPAYYGVVTNVHGKGGLSQFGSSNALECDDGSHHIVFANVKSEAQAGTVGIHSHANSPGPHEIVGENIVGVDVPEGFHIVFVQSEEPNTTNAIRLSGITGNLAAGATTGYAARVRRSRDVTISGVVTPTLRLNAFDNLDSVIFRDAKVKQAKITSAGQSSGYVELDSVTAEESDAEGVNVTGAPNTIGHLVLRDVTSRNAATKGIQVTKCDRVTLSNPVVEGHGQLGIYIFTCGAGVIGTTVEIDDAKVTGTVDTTATNTESVYLDTCGVVTLDGLRVVGGRDGIQVRSCSAGSRVTGFSVHRVGSAGLNIVSSDDLIVGEGVIDGAARGVDGSTAQRAMLGRLKIRNTSSFSIRQQAGCDGWMFWDVDDSQATGGRSLAGTANFPDRAQTVPTDGQALVYDATLKKLKPGPIPAPQSVQGWYPHPKYFAGRFYGAKGATQSGAPTTQRGYWTPVWIPQGQAFDRIGVGVLTIAQAAATCLLGIYADDGNGFPGALLVDGGSVPIDALGQALATITWSAPSSDVYWLLGIAIGNTPTAGALTLVTTVDPVTAANNAASGASVFASSAGWTKTALAALPASGTGADSQIGSGIRTVLRAA